MYWLFEARKRYHLSVLNYMVTSNHIHLLVSDHSKHSRDTILKSIKLVAGRTAYEYSQRKNRKGAFWEDRGYQASFGLEILRPPGNIKSQEALWNYSSLTFIKPSKSQYVERLNLYIKENNPARKAKWSKSIAVGSKVFIEKTRKSLKTKVLKRKDVNHMDCYELREDQVLYDVLNEPENKFVWNP
jgi:putative transposase